MILHPLASAYVLPTEHYFNKVDRFAGHAGGGAVPADLRTKQKEIVEGHEDTIQIFSEDVHSGAHSMIILS